MQRVQDRNLPLSAIWLACCKDAEGFGPLIELCDKGALLLHGKHILMALVLLLIHLLSIRVSIRAGILFFIFWVIVTVAP